MEKKNISWETERVYSRSAIAVINRLKPVFVVVCGDLVNAYPVFDTSHPNYPSNTDPIFDAQVHDFKEDYSLIDPSVMLVCVCGNHDVGNSPNSLSIQNFIRE